MSCMHKTSHNPVNLENKKSVGYIKAQPVWVLGLDISNQKKKNGICELQ